MFLGLALAREPRVELDPVDVQVQLDGILGEEEWQSAVKLSAQHGTEILLQQDAEHLYVGIRGDEGFSIGNIFLRREGRVWDLHASAAIGSFRFEGSRQDGWFVESKAVWTGRARTLDRARADLSSSLQAHGWAGTNASLGNPNEREFAIRLDDFLSAGQNELRLVIAYLQMDGERVASWPLEPGDSTVDPEVHKGFFPDRLSFDDSQWGILVLNGRQ